MTPLAQRAPAAACTKMLALAPRPGTRQPARPLARGLPRSPPQHRRQLQRLRPAAGASDDLPPPPPPPSSHRWLPASLLSGWTGGASLLAVGGLMGSGFDLSGPGSVLEALAVLAAVVGVHELGHFAAARLQGIHVTKFAIGFGPSLLTYQGEVVEYSLRAFPLGGFVAFPDDDPDSPYPPDDPDLLRNRPVLDRALVTVAGVAANIAFAYAICVTQAATVGVADPVYLPGLKLGPILPDTVAERAGLQPGDLLLKVGELEVAPEPGMVGAVVDKIAGSPKRELALELRRGGEALTVRVTPAEVPDGTGRLGVSLAPNVRMEKHEAVGLGQAFALGAKEFKLVWSTVVRGLSQILGNFSETAGQMSGPVAIVALGSEVARADVSGLYRFAAIINVNLAVVNILPLPALDGGYLALQLLETLRRKKLDVEVEKGIMASGFLLLTSLGLLLIAKDAITLGSKLL